MSELLAQAVALLFVCVGLFFGGALAWALTRELVTYRPQGWLEWLVLGWQVLAGCLLVGAMFVAWLRGEAESEARRVAIASFYVLGAGVLVHWLIWLRRDRAREARAAAAPAAAAVLPVQESAEPQPLESDEVGCWMMLSILLGLGFVVLSQVQPGTLLPEWLREWGARTRTPNAGVRVRDGQVDLVVGLLMIAFGGIGLLRQRFASRRASGSRTDDRPGAD